MKYSVLLIVIILIVSLLCSCNINSIGVEEDLINMQVGSYLYTSQVRADTKDERQFLKERDKAVSSMIGYIMNADDRAYKLNDAFDDYESNLRKYMEKIKDASTEDSALMLDILERITSYKVILESYEDAVIAYKKMKPSTEGAKAIISIHIADSVSKLIDTQNEYAAWLIENTAVTAVVLGKENKRQSERLISSSASVYAKQITGKLADAIQYYEAASILNSVILSADYYAGSQYLDEAAKTIEEIKSGKSKADVSDENLMKLESLYEYAENSVKRPPVLKPVPEEKSAFSLMGKVSAAGETRELPPGFHMAATMLEYYTKMNIREIALETALPIEKENVAKEIQEKKTEIEEKPESIEVKVNTTPKPAVEKSKDSSYASSIYSSVSSYVGNAASYVGDKIKETGEAAAEGLKDAAGDLLQAIGVTPEVIVKGAQAYIIQKYTDTDSRYAAIIDKLAEHLANGSKIKESGQTEYILDLINNDLEKMLGENKEYFIDFILFSNTNELVDTFNVWKDSLSGGKDHVYTMSDLIDLLSLMGIEVDENIVKEALAETTPSTIPPPTAAPVTVSPTTAIPVTAAPAPSDESSYYDIAYITADWQTMRGIDNTQDNETVLKEIYGWEDVIDYSQYELKEVRDKNDKLIRIQYMNGSKLIGWEVRFGGDYIEYSYHFPDNNDLRIEIIRYGTSDDSYMFEVGTEDKSINRMTAVRFTDPNEPGNPNSIKYIRQKENNKRDGLNTTLYNSDQTFTVFDMETVMESYTLSGNVLIRELTSSEAEGGILSRIKVYDENSRLKRSYSELDGKNHNTYLVYYENGKLQSSTDYDRGIKDGVTETFFDDGTTEDYAEYINGELHGASYGFYSELPHNKRYEHSYSSGELHGVSRVFIKDGSLDIEANFKNGEYHGSFKDYRVGNEFNVDNYHVFGQYDNGKKVGIWEYGRDNVTWIQRVYYEDGKKIWSEYHDTSYRTYYNEDGTERQEPKPNE